MEVHMEELKIWEKDRRLFESLKILPREELLRTPVHVVPFGVRAEGAFKKKGVQTLGQLCGLTRYELLKMNNMGRKTIRLIGFYLGELGLRLGLRLPLSVESDQPEVEMALAGEKPQSDLAVLLDRQRELLVELEAVTQQIREVVWQA